MNWKIYPTVLSLMMENMILLWFMKHKKQFQLISNVNFLDYYLLFISLMGVLDSTKIGKFFIIFV